MQRIMGKITDFLASKVFFWVVLGLLVFQALWIALTADYPMAFDEEFHVGVIKIYAQHLLPYLPSQPENANQFGALVGDPSYLYHYLMSFPFRIISAITDNLSAQVIMLRLINIAFFATGLYLFRKIMLRAKLSSALTHVGLLLLVLVPVVPLLAGQVNYDNLLVPVVAGIIWLTMDVTDDIKRGRLRLKRLISLTVLACLGSLVKYPLLAILLGLAVFLVTYAIICWRHSWRRVYKSATGEWRRFGRRAQVILCVVLLLSVGLFAQRYATNFVRYGSPVPKCHKVMDEAACASFGPWQRNHKLSLSRSDFDTNPIHYTSVWMSDLWYRLFFALSGPEGGYNTSRPLPVPILAAATIAIGGGAAFVTTARYWWRKPYVWLCLSAICTYCAVLWVDNYSQYMLTSRPVAINGRYLIPLMPLGIILAGMGYSRLLSLTKLSVLKPALACLAIVLMLDGGGIITYIVRSEPDWNWQQSQVQSVNQGAQRFLKPLVTKSHPH